MPFTVRRITSIYTINPDFDFLLIVFFVKPDEVNVRGRSYFPRIRRSLYSHGWVSQSCYTQFVLISGVCQNLELSTPDLGVLS